MASQTAETLTVLPPVISITDALLRSLHIAGIEIEAIDMPASYPEGYQRAIRPTPEQVKAAAAAGLPLWDTCDWAGATRAWAEAHPADAGAEAEAEALHAFCQEYARRNRAAVMPGTDLATAAALSAWGLAKLAGRQPELPPEPLADAPTAPFVARRP